MTRGDSLPPAPWGCGWAASTVSLHSQDRAAVVPGMKPDGSEKVAERNPGDVFWGDAVTHSVENLGTNAIHNLIVELKIPAASR